MGKNPAFMFYPNDWLSDPQLQMTSIHTKGIWIQLLCYMWWSPTRGTIEGTLEDLCRLARCSEDDMQQFFSENSRYNFAVVNCHPVTEASKKVTITNRRMEREERARKSNASRQARYKERHRNALVTPPSPVPSTPSTPVTIKQSTKTLVPVVDKTTTWTDALDEVRRFLLEIRAPDCFYKETYWLRIDQWLWSHDSPVAYFDELKAYLAWCAAQNGRHQHKDMLKGFRNWLSTCSRWKERDAQRQAISSRR